MLRAVPCGVRDACWAWKSKDASTGYRRTEEQRALVALRVFGAVFRLGVMEVHAFVTRGGERMPSCP
jgi:hypothetical protein